MDGASTRPIHHERIRAGSLDFHVARCGEGDRLALCLHGFPESWFSWRYQLPLLAAHGWRAWAPDLRGYGETERPPRMQDYAIELLMQDVANLIDVAGARETLLIGHDWGAIIAWYFAMRKLRPLSRLVILNVPHPAPLSRELRKLRQIRRSWYAAFFQIPWLPDRLLAARGARAIGQAILRSSCDPSRFPDEVLAEYRRAASRPGATTAMLNYYRALVRGGGARRQEALGFPVIETPTLMLWGEEDVALTRETTYGTEAYVRDLTLRYLPGVSHWVQQEAPEQVNALLGAWLEGREVPRSGTSGSA
jgi:pimeloyl-ACP methyl ester carboxylesterase